MHTPHSSRDQKTVTSLIKKGQLLTTVFTLTASALLLCSCANPYSSLYDESPSKLKKDVAFLEEYKNNMCDITEKHGYKEISSGRCLALYYDFKDQSHTKNEMATVAKRVRNILQDPGKANQSTLDQLSTATAAIAECQSYITQNCM